MSGGVNFFDMEDGEFSKLPNGANTLDPPQEDPKPVEEPAPAPQDPPPADEPNPAPPQEADPKPAEGEAPKEQPKAADAGDPQPKDGEGDPPPANQEPPKDQPQPEAPPVDHAGFVTRVMTEGFKANGKTLVPRSHDEMVRLMQMGAGHSRRMEELKPKLRVVAMLEQNQFLDEGKLAFAIDLANGDKGAIAKLLKEKGIEPLDIGGPESAPYSPRAQAVSDQTMAFDAALDELFAQETGAETANVINNTWDDESKQRLGKAPESLSLIHQHRESGLYGLITREMDHRRALGQLPPGCFLDVYNAVGSDLDRSGAIKRFAEEQASKNPSPQPSAAPPSPTPPAAPRLVGQSEEAPRQAPVDPRARAAAPTASTPAKSSQETVNFFDMEDSEFSKAFARR